MTNDELRIHWLTEQLSELCAKVVKNTEFLLKAFEEMKVLSQRLDILEAPPETQEEE